MNSKINNIQNCYIVKETPSNTTNYNRKSIVYCRFYSVKVNSIYLTVVNKDHSLSKQFIEYSNYFLGYITLVSNKRESLPSLMMSNHPIALGNFIEINIDYTLKRRLEELHSKDNILCISIDLHSDKKICKL